jgi:hypothetical protein
MSVSAWQDRLRRRISPLESLPEDVWELVFRELRQSDVIQVRLASKTLHLRVARSCKTLAVRGRGINAKALARSFPCLQKLVINGV